METRQLEQANRAASSEAGKTRVQRWSLRRILIVVAAALLVIWLGASAFVAWKLTHRSRPPFAEPAPPVAWGRIEEHRLTASDGEQIGAWFLRGDSQKPCVLVMHGNYGSRGGMLPVMEMAAESGCSVLAISLRVHGDSTGDRNDFGFSARRDALAAVAFLEEECPNQRILVVGRSLGSAAALFAAEDLRGRVAGYFLEQPYKDLRCAVWNRLQHYLPTGLDWIAYGGLRLWAPVFLPVEIDRVAPAAHLDAIPDNVPIVFLAGSADRHAPLDDVRAMFAQVRSHAHLVVFEGATHVSLDGYDGTLYRKTLLGFLQSQ